MKTLFIGFFVLCTLHSSAQQKNDSKVIVTVSDTANLLNRIALALYDRGYSMEEKDPAGFILTKEKYEKQVVGSRKVRALIRGNTVEFSGLCRLEMSALEREKERFDPVLNKGMKGSLYRVAWDELVEIAKQFGSEITYSK